MKNEMKLLVEQALDGLMPVIALRGADSFAREGGDLDFLVPQSRAVTACRVVAQVACKRGWFLCGYRNIEYLTQLILVRPGAAGSDEAIKIDFFDGLRWYGVGTDVIGYRLFNDFMPTQLEQVRLAGAAGFFQKILIVGQGSERDWDRVAATGANTSYLTNAAQVLGLPITKDHIDARGVRGLAKWRLRAVSGGASGFLSGLIWFHRCAVAHLKFKLTAGSGMGLVLGIAGLDGSGKSTLIDRLVGAYQKAGGVQPELVHLLPSWIPLPHQIIRRRKTQSNYTRPYSEPPVSSWLNGALRLAFYLFVFMLACLSQWIGVKRGRLFILDRSFLDFASDLTRARIPARRLPAWLLRALMPAGRLFFLDASPAVVVARKGELTLEKARALRESYLGSCDSVRATLLDGDCTSDAVFCELLGHVSEEYMGRIHAAEARK